MSIVDVLAQSPEDVPAWLLAPNPCFGRREFFNARTVYYPGSGDDGQPVKSCAKAHAAHTFIYVDYSVEQRDIARWIRDPEIGFRGYAVLDGRPVEADTWRPGGWSAHTVRSEVRRDASRFASPTAWLAVLDRKEGYNADHGPERLGVLFIQTDGVETFDALYCQGDGTPAPYLVVAQNHGGIPDFGNRGLLACLATEADRRPTYLLVADNTDPWAGYLDVGAEPEPGGARCHPRRLFVLPAGADS